MDVEMGIVVLSGCVMPWWPFKASLAPLQTGRVPPGVFSRPTLLANRLTTDKNRPRGIARHSPMVVRKSSEEVESRREGCPSVLGSEFGPKRELRICNPCLGVL